MIGTKEERNRYSFNTQPPKGGWNAFTAFMFDADCFNTQPPKGGWNSKTLKAVKALLFQHTAA